VGKIGNQNGSTRENAGLSVVRAATRNVVEALEARQLMSVSWSNGNLTVNGTNNADTIVVDTVPFVSGMCLVSVTENNVLTLPFVPMLLSKKVTVNGKGGADNIQCQKVEEVAVTVDGGAGNDTIQGGSMNDTLKGGDNNDTIYGRDGNDTLDGGNNDDTLVGGWGADKFIGGGGIDTVDYGNRNDSLYLTINGAADDGVFLEGDNIGLDVENLIGGDGNDLIVGSSAANKLQGGEGSDAIFGFGGADTIYGGMDNDVHVAGVDNQDRDAIHGGDGVDFLYAPVNGSAEIHGDKNSDFIYGSYGRDALHGDDGDDTIEGGWADDLLWGGKGDDILKGGKGDDTLVTIGGGLKDKLYGGDGFDSFWLDQQQPDDIEEVYDRSVDEMTNNHIHHVDQFHNLDINPTQNPMFPATVHYSVSTELDGQDLADPVRPSGATTWKNFSDHPLFPDLVGPVAGDIRQGAVGDCWFGVALSGLARANPDRIKQSVVDLGDGTYACSFKTDDGDVFYRVDGELPVDNNGKLVSLNTGNDGSIWTAIMEKAFAFARADQGTYLSLDGGTPEEAYAGLGCSNAVRYSHDKSFTSATNMLNFIDGERSAGNPVSIGTFDSLSGDTGALIGDHGYDVVKVNKDGYGNCISIELRNPWGVDGKNDGSNPNDGYITVTKAQLWAGTESVWTADA
jgi:hypothetical protein